MPVWLTILLVIAATFAALVVIGNLLVDPAALYRPHRRRQQRNLRLRKLKLLKGARRRPAATLVLGSSRVFNLHLAGVDPFPQPTLNFAVTTAKAEDYLAGYRLVRAGQGEAPRLVIVGIEHPSFHPRMRPQWEAYTSGAYTAELARIGALRRPWWWRWAALLSWWQTLESARAIERRWKARRENPPPKFRWYADGSANWIDLIKGQRNYRLLARQLKYFPRTGLAIRSYARPGAKRLRWFELLLSECAMDGARVLAFVVPAHPQLAELTSALGFDPVHRQLVGELEELCKKHGAVFSDWYDGGPQGFIEDDFRDALHLNTEGQEKVKGLLGELVDKK